MLNSSQDKVVVHLPIAHMRVFLNHMACMLRSVNLGVYSLMVDVGKPSGYVRLYSIYSNIEVVRDENKDNNPSYKAKVFPMSLAQSLASLTKESSIPKERRRRTRMELKRAFEIRIKKRVKEHYMNGKYHDLMAKVIANPETLKDAYDSIRLNSNIKLASDNDNICFTSMAEELASGDFDIKANTFSFSMRTKRKECLVLPNLKLKVIQEAIRIVIEVVYRPHFSKFSHGCRSGRGHHSALRYICKEIRNPDWWFTLNMNKKADTAVLANLISAMEEKIEDASLYSALRSMLDSQVLNLEFGGFPKGQGLPQEGVLSPILMNIYLDLFDREFYRLLMRYEGLCQADVAMQEGEHHSNLRKWFRRQMKNDNGQDKNSGQRFHMCRWMDEIFIAVSGSRDSALSLNSEIRNYLKNSLHLDVDGQTEIYATDNPFGVQFLGYVVRSSVIESGAVRAVHKLKDKVRLFASQKQELWDAGTVRIGKKWLAYGLKKIKESEIKHLADNNSVLSQISCHRKEGMKTDHWFKFLLKIWMQDVNARAEDNEEVVLSKHVAEPALPKELRDSFYNFQKQVEDYISSETATTLELLSSSGIKTSSSAGTRTATTKLELPVSYIKKTLVRYGLINREGFPRRVSALILQDDIQIIQWFEGLLRRWLKWFYGCDNFGDIRIMIVEYVRSSCIRTLAAKHRMHEAEIERRFESELSGIPSTQEVETDIMAMETDFRLPGDEALMYGVTSSGLCVLSLARVVDPSRSCDCSVMGCLAASSGIYALHVMERQKFPGWKTGFSTAIHSSLNRRHIGLCKQHLQDLYLGHISLQCIDFGASRR
ncbi:hypothetical protein MRB53_011376 [Persea americana]|uniref:Uncharacterized protein n=1 Tax=Persea americana TaxID=3435 RepID=A0ACC2LVN3_PERAE|nr:hypothetical protein MRB53_011376 [Persea americana]